MGSRTSTTRSSLAAGSSRRRRMMLNELMTDKETDQYGEEETEKQAEESYQLADQNDLENWMASLEPKPSTTEESLEKAEAKTDASNSPFGQLVDLSELHTEQKKVTSSKQQDRLEQQIPKFTEMVQSFDSPEVQREVFAALVKAFEKEQELKALNK